MIMTVRKHFNISVNEIRFYISVFTDIPVHMCVNDVYLFFFNRIETFPCDPNHLWRRPQLLTLL